MFMDQSYSVIAFSVLISSFLGSVHCLGMCGPICVIVAKDMRQTLFYQLGRLISYLFMALIVGLLGVNLIAQFPKTIAPVIAALSLGITFCAIGLLLIRKQKFHIPLPKVIQKPLGQLIYKTQSQNQSFPLHSFMTGLFAVTLPCGWVYGFIIGSATTQDIKLSLLIMFMFWLGTMPALVLTPTLIHKFINPLKDKIPMTAGLILMASGCVLIITAIARFK
jgi:sulfite exporter TauE/SafE